MKTMPAVAESVYFINQGNHFILHGYAGGFHYTQAVHYGSLKTVDGDIYNDTDIGNAFEPLVGSGFVINLRESLFLFRHQFITDVLAANYTLPNYHVLEESAVSFINLSYGNPDAWFWNFGDGNTSKEKNPVHVYKEPGAYKVRLTAHEGSEYSYYTSDTLVTVHKVLKPKISVSPLSGTPPFEIEIENLSEDFYDNSYIIVGDRFKRYNEDHVIDTITGSGDIYVWLTLRDSVFSFYDYKIVKSEYTELKHDFFELDRGFPEEYVSSSIDTIVLGNYNNLVFSCRHDEYNDNFEMIRTYYTINSVDKDFNNFTTIRTFDEEVDMIKLLNGNYLILFKNEGKSTLEINENGDTISWDRYVISKKRTIKSIKQGNFGRVFTETKNNLITCFDEEGEYLWETMAQKLVSYLPLRNGGLAIGHEVPVYYRYRSFPGYFYDGVVYFLNSAGKKVSNFPAPDCENDPQLLFCGEHKTYWSLNMDNYNYGNDTYITIGSGERYYSDRFFFLSDDLFISLDRKISLMSTE